MDKRKKLLDIIFLALFSSIVVFFGIAIFLFPQKSFSDKENRSLSTIPKISVDDLVSGEYFERLGDFYSDQFPFRDLFTATHGLLELSMGKCETNGVILGKQGTLISRPDGSSYENIKNNIEAINALNNSLLYVPPRSIDVFEDRLPNAYPSPLSDKNISLLNGDTAEDLYKLCESSEKDLYYRTDHHWTTKGAYMAYTQICGRLNITPYSEEYFTMETISTDFRGTSFSRSCLPQAMIPADSISLYRYSGDEDFTVINHETEEEYKGFYRLEHLDTTDKYRVFLGGNYSHLSIASDTPRPKLLLIKDSFANSLVPFLALHFDIEMIDPRYCTKAFLYEQLGRTDVDKRLLLLSFDTLEEISLG